ncbi:MAG TPA: shikimate dehydrogenase [Planctomycetota bacterium]|jgi:3-dehydroquinate dehydratase/shikimate dehydrogenase
MAEICVASHHGSLSDLLADPEFRELAGRDGFIIELRLDSYSDLSTVALDRALNVLGHNVVVTYRHPAEGGRNPHATDAERLGYLQYAAHRGVRYVDIEARTTLAKFEKCNAKVILSYHSFGGVPDLGQLLRQWRTMRETGADIVKIACLPQMVDDSLPLLKLLIAARNAHVPLITLGMGEAGFWTRVAGPLFGAPFTYARGEGSPGTAPGQPTWRELEELYRYRDIQPGWPVYAVIGNPIGHSLSPLLHNTALRLLGMDGVYIPFKVESDPLEFVVDFAPLGLKGLSVTIPHKETIAAICTELDPVAKAVGAVNTLVLRPDGSWQGLNTDVAAAMDSLEAVGGPVAGKKVAILGAGGAGKALAHGAKMRGAAEVFLFDVARDRAEALAKAVGATVVAASELVQRKVDVVVNTTPVGMHPNVQQSPLEKEQIPPGSVVFDVVYNPLRTQFLKWAEERGCKTVSGLSMFVRQGVRQFELWTGRCPPIPEVEKVLLETLKKQQAHK